MTPSFFYEEMDTFDLNKAIGMMDPKVYAECFPEIGGKQDRKALDRAVSLGVIRRD